MNFFSNATSALSAATASPLSIAIVFSSPGGAGAAAAGASSAPAPLPSFASRERVAGEVKLMVGSGKRFEHAGVRVELKGILEASTEKAPHEFLSIVQELAPSGALAGLQSLPFAFEGLDFPVESYSGLKARVRYLVRVLVATRGGFGGSGAERREAEFAVRTPHAAAPALGVGGGGGGGVDAAALAGDPDAPILLEVGIEDCLHIEFQYSRMRYHLQDTVTGHIDFKQLGIKLRKMEVAVVRKEIVGGRELRPPPPSKERLPPPPHTHTPHSPNPLPPPHHLPSLHPLQLGRSRPRRTR